MGAYFLFADVPGTGLAGQCPGRLSSGPAPRLPQLPSSWTAECTPGLSTSGWQQGKSQFEDLLGLPGPEVMVVPSITFHGPEGGQ